MKRFQRTIEDFTCLHCGSSVTGDGYTNHCPDCLWSKHVDINPGDRLHQCHGAMEPIGATKRGDTVKLLHRCSRCGEEKQVKIGAHDNREALYGVIRDGGLG